MRDRRSTDRSTDGLSADANDRMRRRTRALAAPHAEAAATSREQLLVLHRGAERYGVPLGAIATVLAGVHVTPLPGADEPVRGLVAWRNRAIPLYDLAAGIPMPEGPLTVVVLGDERHAIALAADDAEEIVPYERDPAVPPRAATRLRLLVCDVTADATMVVDVDAILAHFTVKR